MNNAQMSARVGLFFLLGCALLWITYEALNGGSFSREDGYAVVARFSTLKELKPGDDVRQAGVKIGSVESTRLADGHAEAVLKINEGTRIAKDATATIAMSGLLGGGYVSLDFGSKEAGYVDRGGQLHTKDTGDINTILADLGSVAGDIKGALAGFSGMTGGAGGQGGIFQKLDKLVSDNGENLTQTIDNLHAITAEIRSGQGTLGKLINDPKAHDELVAAIAEIRAAAGDARVFVNDTRGIIDQAKSGKGPIGTLLYDEKTAEDLRLTVANFRSISDRIAAGEGTLGKLLTDEQLYKDVQGVVRKADRALDGMGDQGPISAVGVAASALF
ncbi:MAG TPA: MlaD family protein [Opitutaceae bacterium]|nr:MlaD family protein [Opitutaceae bacterium]